MSRKPKLNPKKMSELKETKIKMDYSGTYMENDHLDERLEGQLLHIHKAKYKASLGLDESLREAKKLADRETYLRDSIRRWHLRNEQEHASSKKQKQKRPKTVHSVNFSLPDKQSCGLREHSTDESNAANTGKLFNPLTSFAVSLQKSASNHFSQTEIKDIEDESQSSRRKSFSVFTPTPETKNTAIYSRPRSVSLLYQPQTDANEITDDPPRSRSGMNGIHIAKPIGRSMRKLQNEFTLNMNQFGDMLDVYEQRRRSLILTEKEDSDLPCRINAFLKDIDNFTGKNQKNPTHDHTHWSRGRVS